MRIEKDNATAHVDKAASYRGDLALARATEVRLTEQRDQLSRQLNDFESKQLAELNCMLGVEFTTLDAANRQLKLTMRDMRALEGQVQQKSDELKKIQRDMNQWKQQKAKQLEKKFKEELRKISDRAGLLIDDAESGFESNK